MSIKNRIELTIRPQNPLAFSDAMEHVRDLACFLSVAAGRKQGIKRIRITISEDAKGIPEVLQIRPSFAWKDEHLREQSKPHPGDLPLNPIDRADEFRRVLQHWLGRQPDWRTARNRYLTCLGQENSFGPDRLISAANMFDILPRSALPGDTELSVELSSAKSKSQDLFKQLPKSIERSAVLSALGRVGQPSLPKKVVHRTNIVEAAFGDRFKDLQFVVGVAIKCRNFYVHGNGGDIDFNQIKLGTSFLTEALEFVFAASDLIEAGWNPANWLNGSGGWGHSFSRFRIDYREQVEHLKLALGRANATASDREA